jgi:drug/metabolite transporter (DMT)-like permease
MAHEPDPVVLVLKRVDRSKHFMLAAIAALFFTVLFTFGFLMAHARDTAGNAKLLFAATGAQMAFIGACAVLVSFHVTRMTRAVLNAIELSRK